MLKIERVSTRTVSLPLDRPVVSAIHNIERIGCVLVQIETNQNVTGEGLLFTLNDEFLFLMKDAVDRLGEGLVGMDAEDPETAWQKMWQRIQFFGWSGFLIFGMSGIDMAIWDAMARYQKMPIRTLIGGTDQSKPAYASNCLFLDRSEEDLATEAKRLIAEGYRAMKIRVGSGSANNDARRVRIVRDTIGDDIALMADANQALNFDQAVEMGKLLQEYNLTWFEEPMPPQNFEAYTRLRKELNIPIATGESNYTLLDFNALVETRAADILMPDFSRVGGMTQLLKVMRLAEKHGLALSPHLYPEHSISVVASSASATYVEMMPWFSRLFNEKLIIKNGNASVPSGAGFGFSFDQEAIKRFEVMRTSPS